LPALLGRWRSEVPDAVFAHACQQPVHIGLLRRGEGEGFGRSPGGAEEGFAGTGDEQGGESGRVRFDAVCVGPPAGSEDAGAGSNGVLLVIEEEGHLTIKHDPGFVFTDMAVHRWSRASRDQLFGEAEGAAAGSRGNLERPQRIEMPQTLTVTGWQQ
jgi:hypothetical protein